MTQIQDENILVWLPSPMGDAILCTPALRAIREHFKTSRIYFFAKPVVYEILSPSDFNDVWLLQQTNNPFSIAKMLKSYNFGQAILFKNSFGSAIAAFLAGIPVRIGYAREGRSILLTEKLYPPKSGTGRYKPISMIDYYLAISSWLGADAENRKPQLSVDAKDGENLLVKLPQLAKVQGPLIVMVPGGAFGPSKCWPSKKFAETADRLVERYNATVVVSVSPAEAEKKIAKQICDLSEHSLINLAETSLTIGELKSLFSKAALVICNDTGPRHIAIAMQRKIITLFGPNDPAWTETGCENEIKIVGNAPCAPCAEPVCRENEHLCMDDISVETVCEAAAELLANKPKHKPTQEFVEIAPSFFVDADFSGDLQKAGLTSFDAVFSFDKGKNLTKDNLAGFRSRVEFAINQQGTTAFLKRYNKPPILAQIRNWLCHGQRESFACFEFEPVSRLNAIGVNTSKVIACGSDCGGVFEKRSFIITEKIANAESLGRKLPDCVKAPATVEQLKLKRYFIKKLAGFAGKFHKSGHRHRDLYFSHIFYDDSDKFYLIDLARVFRPTVSAERFRVKDIAQMYYSAPVNFFSRTDRLRFYFEYAGINKLRGQDREFVKKVIKKAKRMARHDVKHFREVPFEN